MGPAEATAGPRGLFVGLTTMDVLHRVDRRPAANEKITAARQDVAAGGPAANAAVTFAALGGRSRLLTAIGASGAALVARDDLTRHRVEFLDAAADDYSLAVSAVLVNDGTGERSVVSADAALHEVAAPDGIVVDDVAVVMLDGHHPALAAAVVAAVGDMPAAACPAVVLDCGRWRPVFANLLPVADVAALSADFRLPGVDGAGEKTARAVLATGARAVVITDGGRPVRWWTDAASGSIAVEQQAVRDTRGAGDAFHGALAAAVAGGVKVPEAAERAARVASLRVTSVGPRAWLAELAPWWPVPDAGTA